MHPSFSSLFIHPEKSKPLSFVGFTEDNRWTNGFLWAHEEREMYPVINGIPIFILPTDITGIDKTPGEEHPSWVPGEAPWKTSEMWIKGWPKLAEFAQKIADSEGLIIDIASGPEGGFVPPVLHLNPEATILMDDIRLGLLQEWQAFFKDKGIYPMSRFLYSMQRKCLLNPTR